MSNPKNTKLIDFTSTNNNDFIYTPIAPPAPEATFYEIKHALLNLVMKEQFSSVSTDDVAATSIILLSYVRCKNIRMYMEILLSLNYFLSTETFSNKSAKKI
jgi:endoglucanase Acf2